MTFPTHQFCSQQCSMIKQWLEIADSAIIINSPQFSPAISLQHRVTYDGLCLSNPSTGTFDSPINLAKCISHIETETFNKFTVAQLGGIIIFNTERVD